VLGALARFRNGGVSFLMQQIFMASTSTTSPSSQITMTTLNTNVLKSINVGTLLRITECQELKDGNYFFPNIKIWNSSNSKGDTIIKEFNATLDKDMIKLFTTDKISVTSIQQLNGIIQMTFVCVLM
jgi:hypothetical protein